MPAALAAGSLYYGRRSWPGTVASQLLVIAAGFLLGTVSLLADPAPRPAIGAAALSGLLLAPLLVTSFHALEVLVPPHTLAEASARLVACLSLGQAAGTALAGLVPSTVPAAVPAVAYGGAAAACLLLTTRRHIAVRLHTSGSEPAELPSGPR